MQFRIFKLLAQVPNGFFLSIELVLQVNNLVCQLRYLGDLLSKDLKLTLTFFEFQINHPNLFFLLTNLLLSVLQSVLLDV